MQIDTQRSAMDLERRALLRSAGALFIATTGSDLFAQSISASPPVAQASTVSQPLDKVGAAINPTEGSRTKGSGVLRKGMIGFMLAHEQFPVEQLLGFGAHAEQAGFDLIATSDHLQPWQANQGHSGEAWVTLGALAVRTKNIWLGPTVTCPILRYHPAVVAETYASLNRLAPGRIFLGVGSGEALNEMAGTGNWPRWQERWQRLIEAADIIRKLWSGQSLKHRGKYYTVDAKLYDPPATPIPLLMAANGPKAMRLAGEHGDGLITDPQTWKEHKDKFAEGVTAAGKNVADVPVLIEHYAVVGDTKEVERAAELWRFGPKAFKGYQNISDPAEIQRRAEAEIPLSKVYENWAVGKDAETHIKKIDELFASGASIVNVHSGQSDQNAVIDFYGEKVLPHLRSRIASGE